MKTIVLMLTHLENREVAERFRQMQILDGWKKRLFVDQRFVRQQAYPDCESLDFNFAELRKRYPRIAAAEMFPGNCHVPAIDLLIRSDFDYAWVVEYDVIYTGSWRHFFSQFANADSDLIATHIRANNQPEWHWADSLRNPAGERIRDGVVAFLPIYRISKRAAILVDQRMQEGWSGHQELLVSSLIHFAGYSIYPIRDELYKDTFCWRNPKHLDSIWPNRLYHPKKCKAEIPR